MMSITLPNQTDQLDCSHSVAPEEPAGLRPRLHPPCPSRSHEGLDWLGQDEPELDEVDGIPRQLPRLPQGPTDPEWQAAWVWFDQHFGRWLDRLALRMLRHFPIAPAVEEEARNLRQEFLLACMEHAWLSPRKPIRSPRRFLWTCFWRFVRGRSRHLRAAKRRPPGRRRRAEDATLHGREPDPATAREAASVTAIVGRALATARRQLADRHPHYAKVIEACASTDPALAKDGSLAAALGLTRQQLIHRRHRARDILAALLYEALHDIVGDTELARDIWQHLEPRIGPRARRVAVAAVAAGATHSRASRRSLISVPS